REPGGVLRRSAALRGRGLRAGHPRARLHGRGAFSRAAPRARNRTVSAEDELYAVPPTGFIAARNRLAAELKKAGRADEAARVKALPKPSASLWATNQLARRAPLELRAFIAATRAAIETTAGSGASEAVAAQRERLRNLVEKALAALAEAGVQ